MIEFKNVTKTFTTKDGDVTAVSDVNLNIDDGEIYGIVGYSGAGKSTLTRMLNGLKRQLAVRSILTVIRSRRCPDRNSERNDKRSA